MTSASEEPSLIGDVSGRGVSSVSCIKCNGIFTG